MLKAKTSRRERGDKEAALKELGKEETTRLNAEIPTSLHTQVKLFSVSSKQTITEIVQQSLVEYLRKHSK